MARKTRPENPPESSDDEDAPEIVSKSTSKANAKRDQKALRDFEAEENARRKARHRETDRKLKERANMTRAGKRKGSGAVDLTVEEVDAGSGDEGMSATEARMLKAMKDAAEEADESEDGDGSDDADEFEGFGGFGGIQDSRDDDVEMSPGESEPESEAMMSEDDADDDSDDDVATLPRRTTGKADYLDDAIFAEAFASQKQPPPLDKKDALSTKRETLKKRRRKPLARAKDLVVGGRTIRTLTPLSDPQAHSTARTLPPARARKFVDQSLAIKGKEAARKAKMRGWERRPANIGVMKVDGAPRGFVRQAK